ncbi:lipopolysaccharide biosynthesis protein [Granulicella sp. 5B5]|nr:lipopolysaccharide biosynthesis protein [Granulicella sp. 5B5]
MAPEESDQTLDYDLDAELAFRPPPESNTHWAVRAMLLWRHRSLLARVTVISFLVSLGLAFVIPKQYTAVTSIMPPEPQGSGAMVLAALAGKSGGLGALGSLAGGLLGDHASTFLYISLLESGTVSSHLIDKFNLMHVYHSRYRVNAAKHLAHLTTISDDKKSGVITIKVEDRDPVRARNIAQAYLDELNRILTKTSTSSAHQERVFIENRLHSVQVDLEQAQLQLSEFSSKNNTVDIREQTRAMVDSGARVQAELLVEQSGLQSLRQIYGDGNVRVRETEARIASLKSDLQKMTGSSAPLSANTAISDSASVAGDGSDSLYPPLRQLPRLAVPYADLYRRVKVQEAVFELLTQQYEIARIEEAKDLPVVRVIDSPGVPEKKSFPPRLLLTLLLTLLSLAATAFILVVREQWGGVDPGDPRKLLAAEVLPVLASYIRISPKSRGDHA